jgi:cellobiose phosphorylase
MDTVQDNVNLQYSLFIVRGNMTNVQLLRIAIQDNLQSENDDLIDDIAHHTWMGMAGVPIEGYETSREAFLGPYRGYHNPLAVEKGQCSNSQSYGDNACGCCMVNCTWNLAKAARFSSCGAWDARTTGKRIFAKYGL